MVKKGCIWNNYSLIFLFVGVFRQEELKFRKVIVGRVPAGFLFRGAFILLAGRLYIINSYLCGY